MFTEHASTPVAQISSSSFYIGCGSTSWCSFHIVSLILRSLLRPAPVRPQHETLSDRLTYVSHIRISPLKFVGYEGEGTTLTAVATDSLDRTVQGVKFTWESSNTNKVQIDEMGRATFLQPGLARITCRAGTVEATAPILIRPGHRPRQTDEQWRVDQAGLGIDANPVGSPGAASLLPALLDKLTPTASAQGSWPNDLGYNQLWNDPSNLVGSPLDRIIAPMQLGSVLPEGSNFNWAVPLISLAGRGLSTNFTLYYNSRIWSRRDTRLAFDAVVGWPAPGFSLGFGRIVVYDVGVGGSPNCKFMLVDPDGTRHYLGSGPWENGGYASGGPYETSDGTHIVYTGNGRDGGDLRYPDGTKVTFTSVNNRLLPTSIMDRNGNYIQVAYKPDCYQAGTEIYCGVFPPIAIDYITDTLGRLIQFQYDANGKLTSITAPGFGGMSQNPNTKTLVKFDYQSLSASTNFSGLTVERGSMSQYTLRHIYFPATGTGYIPSYSQYGMIYKVSVRRQMSVVNQPTGFGGWVEVIQDGVETASETFNYPTSAQVALTNAPAFTQRTERAVNSLDSNYTYSPPVDDYVMKTRAINVTLPDATTLKLSRSTDSASPANGLLVQSEITSGSTSLGKTVFTYVNDGGGSPQVQSVTSYDDATPSPNQEKADFDYDQYGNITNTREYGYQSGGVWQVRRRTHYTYHSTLTHSVTLVEVLDAKGDTLDSNDALVAKTSYAYDNYVSMGGVENYGGTANPPGHVNSMGGNVTGITEWVDFASPTPIVIQHLAKYDIFGNVVKAQVSCCQEEDLTNTQDTYWSQPEDIMSGDPNGAHQTTSADYDFNTSLVRSRTDAANQTATYGYDATLTPAGVSLPTGASAGNSFDYGSLSSSSTVSYYDGDVLKTLTTTSQHDGWG